MNKDFPEIKTLKPIEIDPVEEAKRRLEADQILKEAEKLRIESIVLDILTDPNKAPDKHIVIRVLDFINKYTKVWVLLGLFILYMLDIVTKDNIIQLLGG